MQAAHSNIAHSVTVKRYSTEVLWCCECVLGCCERAVGEGGMSVGLTRCGSPQQPQQPQRPTANGSIC